jgi:hypothetical protein
LRHTRDKSQGTGLHVLLRMSTGYEALGANPMFRFARVTSLWLLLCHEGAQDRAEVGVQSGNRRLPPRLAL